MAKAFWLRWLVPGACCFLVFFSSHLKTLPLGPPPAVTLARIYSEREIQETFRLKLGQSAYVLALKANGQPDLATESKLKQEFEKQKTFKVATSLQSADFVFLMLVEYEYNQAYVAGVGGVGSEDIKSVAAVAVVPEAYADHKADFPSLRDKALWQISQNNGAFRGGGLPKKIVKKFHESAIKR